VSVPTPTRTEEKIRQVATLDANGAATITLPRRRPGQPAIVSRLIGAIPASAADVLQDAFERTVLVAADTWGTPAPLGPAWVKIIDDGANQQYGVGAPTFTAGRGGFATLDAVARQFLIQAPVGVKDVDVFVRSLLGPLTAGAQGPGIAARLNAAGTLGYWMWVDGTNVSIRTGNPDGLGTVLATVAKALAVPFNMRLNVVGSTISARAWAAAAIEPTAWDLQVINLTLANTGGVGAWARITTTNQYEFDDMIATSGIISPIWDAYIDSPSQLINIIDSSVTPTDRWIPQIVNGQRINPGEQLVIAPRSGQAGTQAVVTCSFVYAS